MTRKELIDKLVAAATEVYDPREAAAVARLVAEKRFGLSRADIALEPEAEVDLSAEAVDWFSRQISAGRPVQYILGEADFCDMQLIVGEGVLIPRPETEELVRWVLEDVQAWKPEDHLSSERRSGKACEDLAKERTRAYVTEPNSSDNEASPPLSRQILDLCTGSGAIAIALARALPRARVVAVDNSPEALDFARRNNRKYDAGVEIIEADVLDLLPSLDPSCEATRQSAAPPGGGLSAQPLLASDLAMSPQMFDIIVANPPYIPASERARMAPNVTDHEPAGALFVPDNDPLVFYRAIARLARKLLRPAGGNGRSEGELRDTNLGSPQPPKGEPTACQCKPKTPHAAALYLEINEDLADETVELLRTEGFTQVTVREDINGKKRMIKAEN